jgi:hypothetical protein
LLGVGFRISRSRSSNASAIASAEIEDAIDTAPKAIHFCNISRLESKTKNRDDVVPLPVRDTIAHAFVEEKMITLQPSVS